MQGWGARAGQQKEARGGSMAYLMTSLNSKTPARKGSRSRGPKPGERGHAPHIRVYKAQAARRACDKQGEESACGRSGVVCGGGGGIWLGSVERPPSSMQSETQSAAISGKQRGKVAKEVTIFEAQKLK